MGKPLLHYDPASEAALPEKVEFMTSAGLFSGGNSRAERGLRGGGMVGVVTDIGMLEPDENGEMILTALHPGKTVEDAKANTGWDLKVAAQVRVTEMVTEKELQILREELDPTGIYLKGAANKKLGACRLRVFLLTGWHRAANTNIRA